MTQIITRAGIVLALMTGAACRPSASPEVHNSAPLRDSAANTASTRQPADSSTRPDGLGLFGGGRRALPEGVVAGGDCPPGGPDAAEEIAAQADAAVPLKPGLTFAYVWNPTPQEEYECLIQVQKTDADGIDTSLSCNYPQRPGPFFKRVCRTDLRSARLLHTEFGVMKVLGPDGKELPETIVGTTAFSVSSAAFAELKRTGSIPHHYIELESSGQLAKEGIGTWRLGGRETMRIGVNDGPIEVPVIRVSGTTRWWIQGQSLEAEDTAVILDDERFPLLIDQHGRNEAVDSRIQFAKISFPRDRDTRGSLEQQLLDDRRVDVYGIYFDFASDRIRTESEPILSEIAGVLKRHTDWRLSIDGHTDSVGGDPYNMDLSRRRSESVRAALVNRFGIPADRLTAAGHGASAPKDTNDTSAGRARNRRVELVRR